MAKDHWDAILASSPLNATAGAVTAKGVHFEPDAQLQNLAWDVCPPLVRLRKPYPETFVDLTGRKFGRMTVVGYLGKLNPRKKAVWVCRCACGRFEGRHASSINSGNASMCQHCAYTAKLRRSVEGDGARRRAESEEARKW